VTNWVLSPRGTADDSTAGRHFQDRAPHVRREQLANVAGIDLLAERTTLPPTVTPAFGYTVVPRRSLRTYTLAGAMSEDATVENDRHRLTFDRETGGVIGWHDKRLAYEWVDAQAGYRLNTFVHEEVADHDHVWPRHRLFQMKWDSEYVERARGWKPGWRARRRLAMKVLAHNVFRLPAGIEVMQVLEAPGIEGALVQSTFLPDYAEWVEFRAHWRMTTTTHPEATYLLYPFDLPGATARLDLGGQAMIPGVDQIPGVCYDYFTVQNWVDFNNGQRGVTIATPDNPMVQLGDFHFGHNQAGFALERALLLGWVTNTYWETNFRAQQPGMVTARYRVQPYAGAFDEAGASLRPRRGQRRAAAPAAWRADAGDAAACKRRAAHAAAAAGVGAAHPAGGRPRRRAAAQRQRQPAEVRRSAPAGDAFTAAHALRSLRPASPGTRRRRRQGDARSGSTRDGRRQLEEGIGD
jgi:alpha-mannosidase